VTLFTGGIRTTEHEHMARLLRRTSSVLVAFGSCAMEGCIPGLANLSTVDEILEAAFEGPSTDNPEHLRPQAVWVAPEGELRLPPLLPLLKTLEHVVPVDYTIPGCPPETERIAEVVGVLVAALDGKLPLPPHGAVLGAGHSTVCDSAACDRDVKRMALRSYPVARRDRSRGLPARAGPALQRAGDAGRLRGEVPGRRSTVHRLLRGDRWRRRPGGAAALGVRLDRRRLRARGHRRHPRWAA
jgi:Ni,Fe-hydrogenase III small subunit